jgi:hypothetical protein
MNTGYNNTSVPGFPDQTWILVLSTPTPAAGVTVSATFTTSSMSVVEVLPPPPPPTIVVDPTTAANGTVGSAYSQTFTASGGTSPYTFTRSSGTLPPGLTLSSGGVLSGTPTTAGSYTFRVRATDAGSYSGSRSYTVAIIGATITVSPSSLPNGTVGSAYSATVSASGGTAPYSYAVTTGALPGGLSLSSGGALSGTPTASGTFNFTVTATDSTSQTGSQAYTVTVAAAPIIVQPATLPGATVASAYSQAITATGGTGGFSYAVTAGALPAGLSLSSAGVLSGTPTASGTFTFTVTATDSASQTGSRAYTLTVAQPTVSVAPATLPNASAGSAYSQAVTASGGIAPYTYQVSAGALPAGLTLSSAGVLSGTPTAAGSFSFTVSATDSSTGTGPASGMRAYTLVVGMPTLQITPATLSSGVAGTPYSATVVAAAGTSPYTYQVSAGTLPAGLALSSAGVLSGTPTAAGSFPFTVTATDSTTGTGPATATMDYTLVIAVPELTVSPATLPEGVAGAAYSQTITASGGVGDHTFAVSGGTLPAGLALAADGTLSGTPTEAGSFPFTVTATDSTTGTGPATATMDYTLVIAVPELTVSPETLPDGVAGTAYSQTITASGGVAEYTFAVSDGTLPAGLALAADGTLSGTATEAGSFPFTLMATDATTGTGPATATKDYTLVIDAPVLSLAPETLPDAVAGTAYSQAITASGGVGASTFALSAGVLPAGLALAADGTLSGTPTEAGSFEITVTATDSTVGTPGTGSATYTLVVTLPSVTVSPAALFRGVVGDAWSTTLTATGGVSPYTFAVTAGALPAGLTLAPGGLLSGTPTEAGTFPFSVTASDATTGDGPATGTIEYTLVIEAAPVIAVTGTNQAMYVRRDTEPGWTNLEGKLIAAPAVARTADGVVHYLGIGTNNRIYQRTDTTGWRQLTTIAYQCAQITAAAAPTGSTIVGGCTAGANKALYTFSFDGSQLQPTVAVLTKMTPSDTVFSPAQIAWTAATPATAYALFKGVGTSVGDTYRVDIGPATITAQSHASVRGPAVSAAGHYQAYQKADNTIVVFTPSTHYSLPGQSKGVPAIVEHGDGTADLYVTGTNGQLYNWHLTSTSPGPQTWWTVTPTMTNFGPGAA